MALPLEGIRVLDLTMWFQGPVAGQYLADFGAEVIKLESPKGGDLARGVRSIKALAIGDWNQYFHVINRNKKSLALDLNKPEGREVIHDLAKTSDVFLTNLSTKALGKWGCSYDELSAVNDKLVYAMGSGYGPHGRITKPSFDLTVQALIGLMTRLGEPGQPPIYLGMGSGDAMGGLMAAFGIMMALVARQKTGKGQFLDASLYGAQTFLAAPTLQGYLATGSEKFSRQVSRKEPANPTWNTYRAADDWVVLCVPNTNQAWQTFAATLGDADVAGAENFATVAARKQNSAALVAELDRLIGDRDAGAWLDAWRAAGLACERVADFSDLRADAQAWDNDYFLKTVCAEVNREVEIRGLPVGLSKTPGRVESLGPELGQDTEIIMMDTLGYEWERIEKLKQAGAIL